MNLFFVCVAAGDRTTLIRSPLSDKIAGAYYTFTILILFCDISIGIVIEAHYTAGNV